MKGHFGTNKVWFNIVLSFFMCAQLPLVLVFLGIRAIRELQVYPENEKIQIGFT